jgi:hypothetical protein
MAKYVARFHERYVSVLEMEVRAANRTGCHPNESVASVFDLGLRNIAPDVTLAVPTQRFHQFTPGT